MTPAVAATFAWQVDWCQRFGSPFTARLLGLLAREPAAGALVGDWPGDPMADALPLRLAGALHALVLGGAAPSLAACYPPHDDSGLSAALPGALAEHAGFIRGFIASPPQTNETARSAVLLGGFLCIAAATGLPLRMLEIGASAGLNLVWDRYRYRLGGGVWGDSASPVVLAPGWDGPPPPLDAPLVVAGRAACDIAPVDLADPAQRLRLRAYVWADQGERLARLDHAIGVARAAGHGVERADAAAWVGARFLPEAGLVTVLYHSIMWQYLPEAARVAIAGSVVRAGATASATAPVAWLRFEPPRAEAKAELWLTLWPWGGERCLARADAHGRGVEWLAVGLGVG